MLKSAGNGLREVPFPVSDPERIPVQRYFDEEFYQAELEHLWPHVWQNACRLEQIPEVGDWIEYSNVGKSVIIVRTEGGIKAFHNACRHRGVPFAGGQPLDKDYSSAFGNCSKKGFVCPFHGWAWNMDGQSTRVYGKHLLSDRQLDPDDVNLVPCRVDTWAGMVWINLDNDAPSVRETLGQVTEDFDMHGVENLRAEWHYGTVLPSNWKIAMEAFMEGYHVMQTHPQLHEASPSMYSSMYESPGARGMEGNITERPRVASEAIDIKKAIEAQIHSFQLLSDGMAGMIHQKEVDILREMPIDSLPDDPEQAIPMWFGMGMRAVTEGLRARGEPCPDILEVSQSHPVSAVQFFFPHYFLLPTFASMSAYRIRPLGPEKCFFEIWSLTTYAEEPDPVMEPTVLPYNSPEFPQIPRQDYSNIPIQQAGMHAQGFEFMRLSKDVEGMISNYQRIIDGYLKGLPVEKLNAAIHELRLNFDGPIKDLDL
jgi:phenylpropionate dioxygenase-like ring-hydroxylating dioxygenase large terminal subunit